MIVSINDLVVGFLIIFIMKIYALLSGALAVVTHLLMDGKKYG